MVKGWRMLSKTCFVPHNSVEDGCRIGEKGLFPGGGGVLPYMGYIGMCRCEGYDFQAVYSRTGYINQTVWV